MIPREEYDIQKVVTFCRDPVVLDWQTEQWPEILSCSCAHYLHGNFDPLFQGTPPDLPVLDADLTPDLVMNMMGRKFTTGCALLFLVKPHHSLCM